MKLHRVLLVLLAMTVVIFPALQVEARSAPNHFGHRRLLNLSGSWDELLAVPSSLSVPPGHEVFTCLQGEGKHEYTYNGSTWEKVNISAVLSTFGGQKVGQTFNLPEKDALGGQQLIFQSFNHESSVIAVFLSSVVMSPDSIPWVVYEGTSNSGTAPIFGEVTYLQMLSTSQGLPPSQAGKVGDLVESPFTATYCLFKTI